MPDKWIGTALIKVGEKYDMSVKVGVNGTIEEKSGKLIAYSIDYNSLPFTWTNENVYYDFIKIPETVGRQP